MKWTADLCAYAGGNSLFVSMKERLERDLQDLAPPNARVKITCPPNTLERRFSVWLGKHSAGNSCLLALTSCLNFHVTLDYVP